MKKFLLCGAALLSLSSMQAQRAVDAYSFSQTDLKGTARFMSMGGAFGALGGDLTVLNQNPGGIGVYRSNDIGFTIELDAQQSEATSQGLGNKWDRTPFYLNNIGFVSTVPCGGALRNINIGFTFNKTASFNRRFRGNTGPLSMSMTNYIAALANNEGVTVGDVAVSTGFNPYYPNDGGYQAPWVTILGYDSYLINPSGNPDKPVWQGQWGEGTSGTGYFQVEERGSMDEYNIAIGGNVNDVFYWGMDFGIINFQYAQQSLWGENLTDAWVAPAASNETERTTSDWNITDLYRVTGTGFNYKLGFIVRPVQQLRIGVAMHTPTWYSLEQSYVGGTSCLYGNHRGNAGQVTNDGMEAVYDYRFRTPWRFIASLAGVIANRLIVSADYEIASYRTMHFTDKYADDNWISSSGIRDPYHYENSDIKNMYDVVNSFRLGAEYRVTKGLSLRAGYAWSPSPVKKSYRDNMETVYTDGLRLGYVLDDDTYYITGGLGFRSGGFYTDLAYVYKNREAFYHPYPSDPQAPYATPQVRVSSVNHQIVLTMGWKF